VTACVLHATLGRGVECPGADCALWDASCTVESLELDLRGREDLAAYLLDVRAQLEQLRDEGRPAAR
jgi:hypothetical protein